MEEEVDILSLACLVGVPPLVSDGLYLSSAKEKKKGTRKRGNGLRYLLAQEEMPVLLN